MCHFTIAQTTIHGRSVNVADGDTFTLLDDNNTQHRIRLYGIDAPERGQAFGNRSREYLASMIVGKTLTVTYTEKDNYERILGKVSTESILDVNLRMIQSGMRYLGKFSTKGEYAESLGMASSSNLLRIERNESYEPSLNSIYLLLKINDVNLD